MNGKITKLNNLPEGTDEKSLIEQWNKRALTPEIAGVDDAAIEVANEMASVSATPAETDLTVAAVSSSPSPVATGTAPYVSESIKNEDERTKADLDAKMKSEYEAKGYKAEQNKLAISKLGTNIGKYGTIAGNIAGSFGKDGSNAKSDEINGYADSAVNVVGMMGPWGAAAAGAYKALDGISAATGNDYLAADGDTDSWKSAIPFAGAGQERVHQIQGIDSVTASGYGGINSSVNDLNSSIPTGGGNSNFLANKARQISRKVALANKIGDKGKSLDLKDSSIALNKWNTALSGGHEMTYAGKKGMKIMQMKEEVRRIQNSVKKDDYITIPVYSEEDDYFVPINYIDEDKVDVFEQGGKMSVIPNGMLHANLHNMDIGGNVTKKGIPVITDDGKVITQTAEVEREEIIFTKELTEKLEELERDGSDEAAIEAGKLVTEEIMKNTQDNSGIIKKVIKEERNADRDRK